MSVNKKNEDIRYTFLYKDLCSDGGAPQDMRNFLEYIGLSQFVRSISWGAGAQKKIVRSRHFSNILLAIKFVYCEKFSDTDRVILVGGLIFSNVIFALILFLRRIDFDYMPLSHWSAWSLSQKIFSEFPEINSLKANKQKVIGSKIKSKVVNIFLVLAKKTFFFMFRPIFNKSSILWVASPWEAAEAARCLNRDNINYRIYQFGCDLTIEMPVSSSYFEQFLQNVNIVFWGRVDYLHKGLDRLVEICEINHHFLLQNRVLIHILGPDYNGGLNKLKTEISSRGIERLFKIIPPEKLHKIGIEGLACSDGTVLFTRFEGHPRVLREAQYFGLPILSSTEAHNNWYVECDQFMTIDFALDHACYNRQFKKFIEMSKLHKYRTKRLVKEATWEEICENNQLYSDIRVLKHGK